MPLSPLMFLQKIMASLSFDIKNLIGYERSQRMGNNSLLLTRRPSECIKKDNQLLTKIGELEEEGKIAKEGNFPIVSVITPTITAAL